MYHDLILLIAIIGIFALFTLIGNGFVGPRWLRRLMHGYNRWYYKGSALLFPLDPDKPLTIALKKGLVDFWPTKERWHDLNRPLPISWIVIFSLSIIAPALLIVFVLAHAHSLSR